MPHLGDHRFAVLDINSKVLVGDSLLKIVCPAASAYCVTFHWQWINTTSSCGDTRTDIGFFRSFITSTPQGMGNLLLSSGNN
jgi:hypothetical protein